MEIRRSYDHLVSTMGFPILARRYLYIESGPCLLQHNLIVHFSFSTVLWHRHCHIRWCLGTTAHRSMLPNEKCATSQSFLVIGCIPEWWKSATTHFNKTNDHWQRRLDAMYRQFSNIRRTQSQNINVSRLVLLLYLPNPLKPGVKLRMKM